MTLLSTLDGSLRGAWRVPLTPGQRWAQDTDLLSVHRRTTTRTGPEGRAA
jgi:hypothetical protein